MTRSEHIPLREFWTPAMKARWNKEFPKGAPTTHQNCRKVFGCNRPGKTARDRRRV